MPPKGRRHYGQVSPETKNTGFELQDDDQENIDKQDLTDDGYDDLDEVETDDDDQDLIDEGSGDDLEENDSDDDQDSPDDTDRDWDSDDDLEGGKGNTAGVKPKRNLLLMRQVLRVPRIDEGNYTAVVENVKGEEKTGEYGKYTLISIFFKIKKADKSSVTVPLRAAMSLTPESRLFKIVKGILGRDPEEGTDLIELKGQRVRVLIEHWEDAKGNLWEDIVEIARIA